MKQRRPGRPRTAMRTMDAALFGQLRSVVLEMDDRGMPWPHIAQQLAVRTGVRVHPRTIANWAKEFRNDGGDREGR